MSQQPGRGNLPFCRPGVISTLRGAQQPWRGKSRFVVQTWYQKACLSSPGIETHLSIVIVMHRNAGKFVSGARKVVVVAVVAISSSGGGGSS